jgi:two-component system OmpR family response regulator
MPKRVLIIDDAKNIRLLLTKCLELEGFEVTSAPSGKQGLEMIFDQKYDLIFLDVKLPEISGTEVLRRMRKADIQTPVIIITAYPTIKNAIDCTRLGVVSYLQKPFTAERLRSILQNLELESGEEQQKHLKVAAEAAMAEGNPAQALALLKTALGKAPGDGAIYSKMASAYAAMGDEQTAEKYRKAAEIFNQK